MQEKDVQLFGRFVNSPEYVRRADVRDIENDFEKWKPKVSKITQSFKGVGKIYYITKEIAERWKEGLDKTWLNFKLRVPYVIGVSGDYVYFIRIRNPREVNFDRIPDFYKKCVNPKKKIYEYDAKLERIERREWRKVA